MFTPLSCDVIDIIRGLSSFSLQFGRRSAVIMDMEIALKVKYREEQMKVVEKKDAC